METKEKRTKVVVTVLALAGLLGLTIFATAGLLEPSAAPGPTMKTLAEVEPRTPVQNLSGSTNAVYVITDPGSYYLTGNIQGQSGKNGIEITANGVTLDLNGFQLEGVPGSLSGVKSSDSLFNLAVLNGTLRNWPSGGVDISSASYSQLRNLRALSNSGDGLAVGGGSTVSDCQAHWSGGDGIAVGDRSTVSNCTASYSGGNGINAFGSTISECSVSNNGGDGINAGSGSTVSGCTVYSSGGKGIVAGNNSTVIGCTTALCKGGGISVNFSSVVRNCVSGSDGTNGGHGIVASSSNCIISGCTVRSSANDGIQVSSNSLVVGNLCDDNGAAGIHAVVGYEGGHGNRIEANTVTDNTRGIDVDSDGNLIIRNSARGNTSNYDIVAGNSYGQIINVAGAGSFVSTDPSANFAF